MKQHCLVVTSADTIDILCVYIDALLEEVPSVFHQISCEWWKQSL